MNKSALIVIVVAVIIIGFIVYHYATPSSVTGLPTVSTTVPTTYFSPVPFSFHTSMVDILSSFPSMNISFIFPSNPGVGSAGFNGSLSYTARKVSIAGNEIYEMNLSVSNNTTSYLPVPIYFYANGTIDSNQTLIAVKSAYPNIFTSGFNSTTNTTNNAALRSIIISQNIIPIIIEQFLDGNMTSHTPANSTFMSHLSNSTSLQTIDGVQMVVTTYTLSGMPQQSSSSGPLSLKMEIGELKSNPSAIILLYFDVTGISPSPTVQVLFKVNSLS